MNNVTATATDVLYVRPDGSCFYNTPTGSPVQFTSEDEAQDALDFDGWMTVEHIGAQQ